MNQDEQTARAIIEALPKAGSSAASIKNFLEGRGAAAGEAKDLAQMSWEEIDKAERLGELKEKFPELYKQKFQEAFGM
jgi:hypothetical protein